MNTPLAPGVDLAVFLKRLQWAFVLLAVLYLIYLLGPILTPFVVAALLGWLGDPLVDRLERAGRSRNTAVMLVFTLMALLLALAVIVMVPLFERQMVTLIAALPGYRDWAVNTLLPWFERRTGLQVAVWMDSGRIVELLRSHLAGAGGIAATVVAYLSRSSFAVLAMITNIVLIPVLAFFFLRDWDLIVGRIAAMVPRDHIATVSRLAQQSSDVLGGFLRGQFLVMLILGVLYGAGLWAVGLELGLLIGVIAGIFTFVPYLGPAAVIVLGGIAAVVQYGDWKHILGVVGVFAVGQVIESYWLTPKLVGNRIGLHPMAVIFAVLAGGQLFGFLGMLIALPVAAVGNVMLRYAHDRYTHSRLYAGEQPTIVLDPYLGNGAGGMGGMGTGATAPGTAGPGGAGGVVAVDGSSVVVATRTPGKA